jgi:hypothetical protein
MMDYNHWAAFGFLGEILPHPENRVQLAEEKDRFGLPVAKITFTPCAPQQLEAEFGQRKQENGRLAEPDNTSNNQRWNYELGGRRKLCSRAKWPLSPAVRAGSVPE